MKRVPLNKLHPAEWNPRMLKEERFKNLCKSIENDPEFMELRPILARKPCYYKPMPKAPKKTPKEANLKEPWKKGECPNPNGRPKGQRNYATIYWEAMKKIAANQNMTPEELEEVLHQSGITKAIKGDYAFYRDTLDRLHGKPTQPLQFDPHTLSDTELDAKIRAITAEIGTEGDTLEVLGGEEAESEGGAD